MISLDSIDYSVHSIKIADAAGDILAIDASGFITISNTSFDVTDGGGSLTVDGTVELGATTLAALETIELGATTLAALENITVSATDLDIRNLVFATDKVDVSGSSVATTPTSFASWKVTAASATTTESELVSTPLTGRLRIEIQNLGNKSVYLKNVTGVSTANGVELPSKASVEWDLDDGADIFAITASGSADLRIVEFAA